MHVAPSASELLAGASIGQSAMPIPQAQSGNLSTLCLVHGDEAIADSLMINHLKELTIGESREVGQLQVAQLQANLFENVRMTLHLNLIDALIAGEILAGEQRAGQSQSQVEENSGESAETIANPVVVVDVTPDVESQGSIASISPPIAPASPTIAKAPPPMGIAPQRSSSPIASSGTARGSESANPNLLPVSRCPYADVRRKSAPASSGGQSSSSILPPVQLRPDMCEPSEMSTIFVRNLPFGVGELGIIEYFNSLGGEFPNRCTAISAVNSVYSKSMSSEETPKITGPAYFLFANRELAKKCVANVQGHNFRGRSLEVVISNRRLDCKNSGTLVIGQSRWGSDIGCCPS